MAVEKHSDSFFLGGGVHRRQKEGVFNGHLFLYLIINDKQS